MYIIGLGLSFTISGYTINLYATKQAAVIQKKEEKLLQKKAAKSEEKVPKKRSKVFLEDEKSKVTDA